MQATALVLMTLGSFIAALNWLYLFLTWYTGRFHSTIPLLGGFSLCMGMLLLPATRPWAWTAMLLDYSMIVFLFVLPRIVNELWSTSQVNLLEEYIGQLGIKTIHLRLFRKNIFILKQRIRRGHGKYCFMELSRVGEWEREGDRLLLRLNEGSAVLESSPGIASESLRLARDFAGHEGSELSLAGIDLKLTYKRTA